MVLIEKEVLTAQNLDFLLMKSFTKETNQSCKKGVCIKKPLKYTYTS